ncbi:hypothetical protein HDU80_007451 [Chytriomyces hyalinus]|nr:hypothetical protein HDU80_007451 [Chytriomyces hyalinus]
MTKIYCSQQRHGLHAIQYRHQRHQRTVKDLKKAICPVKVNDLGHPAADKLTLVRIFTASEDGLTAIELNRLKELLNKESFGKDPEDAEDKVYRLRGVPSDCLVKEDSYCGLLHLSSVDRKTTGHEINGEGWNQLLITEVDKFAILEHEITTAVEESLKKARPKSKTDSGDNLLHELNVRKLHDTKLEICHLDYDPSWLKWSPSKANKAAHLAFIKVGFGDFPRRADALTPSVFTAESTVSQMPLLFKLKKERDTNLKTLQLQLQLLCADNKLCYPVLAVVSDLRGYWQLLWVDDHNQTEKKSIRCSLAVGIIGAYLKAVQNMIHRRSITLKESDFLDQGNDSGNV